MIGKLLGHTQVQTTARYAHLARDSIQNAAARITGSIGGNLSSVQGADKDTGQSARTVCVTSSDPRGDAGLGAPLRDQVLRPCRRHAAPERTNRRIRRGEVLVPRTTQLFRQRRRPRPDAAGEPDEAAGQSFPSPGCDRGLRRRLDHRVTARRRAVYRRSHRQPDSQRYVDPRAGLKKDATQDGVDSLRDKR